MFLRNVKTAILLAVMMLLWCASLLGQSSTWELGGNNNVDSLCFLGTTNMATLEFRTDNVTRLAIDNTGRLRVTGLAGNGLRLLMADSSGGLVPGALVLGPGGPGTSSCTPAVADAWYQDIVGGALAFCPGYGKVRIGNDPVANFGNLSNMMLDVRGDARIVGDLVLHGLTGSGGGPLYVDAQGKLTLSQPSQNLPLWSVLGNAAGSADFIGTTNAEDLLLKANSQTVLQLKTNGEVEVPGLAGISGGPVYADACGVLSLSPPPGLTGEWSLAGNAVSSGDFVGTSNSSPLNLKTVKNVPIRFQTGGQLRMEVGANGAVGINVPGGSTPVTRLKVITDPTDRVAISSVARFNSDYHYGIKSIVNRDNTKAFAVVNETYTAGGATPFGQDVFRIFGDGRVETKRIKVFLSGWSDHVFREDYQLMSLNRLDRFIQENGHLPGVPTEQEILAEGDDLGATDALLLEKIEELTLHLIAQEKRIVELEMQLESERREER